MPLDEKLKYERELLGLYISDNPLNYKKEIFKKETTRTLAEINNSLIDRGVKVGGIINEIKKALSVYNEAWEKNWGFVPWTEKEFYTIAKRLKDVLLLDTTLIAEINGTPVGILIAVPD